MGRSNWKPLSEKTKEALKEWHDKVDPIDMLDLLKAFSAIVNELRGEKLSHTVWRAVTAGTDIYERLLDITNLGGKFDVESRVNADRMGLSLEEYEAEREKRENPLSFLRDTLLGAAKSEAKEDEKLFQ